jgi:hypothetical protein
MQATRAVATSLVTYLFRVFAILQQTPAQLMRKARYLSII